MLSRHVGPVTVRVRDRGFHATISLVTTGEASDTTAGHPASDQLWRLWSGSQRLWPDPTDGLPRIHRLKSATHWLTAFFTIVIMVFGASSGRPDESAVVSIAALSTGVVLLMVDTWPWARALALAVALGAVAVATSGGPTPANVLSVIFFNLVVSRTTRSLTVLLPAVAASYVVVMSLTDHDVSTAIDDSILALPPALGASVFLTSVVRNVERSDRLHEERIRIELAGSFDSAARAALETVHQLLHDRVLAALNSIISHAPAERTRLREYCGQVAHDIQGPPELLEGTATIRTVIDQARDAVPLEVSVQLAPDGADVALPSGTAAALHRAVGEALRNCARHAGVAVATVRVKTSGPVSSLTVSDTGRGFASQGVGWGIANSIAQPMARVGGGAHVDSRPGTGTTVTLTWPSPPPSTQPSRLRETYRETREAVGDVPVMSLIVTPLLLSNAYLAVRYSLGDTTAVPQLALALGATLATFALVRRLLRRGPTRETVVGITVVSALTVALGLFLAEPNEALTTYDSWCIGLAAVGPFVLAFYLPPTWWSIVLVPNVTLVILAARLEPTVEITDALGALNAALLPAYPLAGGAAVRAAERQLNREVTRLAEATRQLGRSQDHGGLQAQEQFLSARVAPWLLRVASGEVAIGEPEASETARLLAAEARDTLNLPGVLDDPMRDRLTAVRRAGTAVTLVPGDEDDGTRALGIRLLDRALDHASLLSSIVLYFAESGTTKLTTVPELPDHRLPSVLGCLEEAPHRVENDGLTTTIVVGRATEIA